MKDGIKIGTRDEWKDFLPIITAFVEGKEIQCRGGFPCDHPETAKWMRCSNVTLSPTICYRIAPEPKWRKWALNEVPIGAQVRYRGDDKSVRLLIVGTFQPDKVMLGSAFETNTKFLLDQREHSTDGGKTWLPCGVLESQ